MREADPVGLFGSLPHDEENLHSALGTLTATEQRVLRHLAVARTSRAVSEALYISVRTVEKHRSNIVRKLGLRGANALLTFAVEHAALIDKMEGGGAKKIPG